MKYLQFLVITLFRLLVILLVIGAIIGGYGYFYIKYKLPNVEVLKNIPLQMPMKIYTLDGKLISEFGEKRRTPVKLNEVPPLLINAFLATEDQRFYEHSGVDPISLLRAVKQLVLTGRKEQGASTITMQVARNFFLSRKKTFTRKLNEVLLAMMIEQEFSKDEILELYLNKIYLGNRAYGVAAAARVYYDKSLDQLTLSEMAMIAGLAQAPSQNNPLANPKAALLRRNHVLSRMFEHHYIEKAAYEKAIQMPLTEKYHGPKIEFDAPYLAEMVRQAMYEKYGEAVYNEGFNVYTTVSSGIQQAATDALQNNLIAYDKRHNGYRTPKQNLGRPTSANRAQWLKELRKHPVVARMIPAAVLSTQSKTATVLLRNGEEVSVPLTGSSLVRRSSANVFRVGNVIRVRKNANNVWELAQIPQVEGAIVALNPNDGAIIALAGGFDFYRNSFNRVTQGELQPGSSFKPFIYSAALAQGFTLASIINDSPIVIHIPGQRAWAPKNSTGRFYGPTRLRDALTFSRNLVSIRLLEAIGLPNAIDYLTRFGFDPQRLPKNLTLALGTANLTPLEMVTAYAVFANGGYRVNPYFIDHITDRYGKLIYQAQPKLACPNCHDIDALTPVAPPPDRIAPQVISPQNAFLITSALQDVIRRGTGRRALVLKRNDIAGKTGTTNDKIDAWFSGYNSDVVATVWMGFDQPKSLHEYGAEAALPVWIDFMSKALAGKAEHTTPEPPGLIYVRIDPSNGQRVASGKGGVFEVFSVDSEPEAQPYYDYFDYERNANSTDTPSYLPQDSYDDEGEHLF